MGEPRDFGLTPKDQSIQGVESLDKTKIIIKPEDIPGHLSEFRETDDDLLVCLDADKGIWIHIGVPVESKETDNKVIRIPSSPHVFMAHSLCAIDQDHPAGANFTNVPVIFAHGGRRNGKWIFQDGQGVVDTVNAFDEYCIRNERNFPRVEFVLSCNKDEPSLVKVKDFQTHRPIVQAVGDVVFLNNAQMREGKVDVTVQTDKFWGLDDLKISKQIKVRRIGG